MGLSNGFGAIAGIIVPLGKPSIVKSQTVSFSLLLIKLNIVISTVNPSKALSILFSKLQLTLDLGKISEMVSIVNLNLELIIIER